LRYSKRGRAAHPFLHHTTGRRAAAKTSLKRPRKNPTCQVGFFRLISSFSCSDLVRCRRNPRSLKYVPRPTRFSTRGANRPQKTILTPASAFCQAMGLDARLQGQERCINTRSTQRSEESESIIFTKNQWSM
jgi:hypothetical protein